MRETGPDRSTEADAWLPEGAKPRSTDKADDPANGDVRTAKPTDSEALEWLPAEPGAPSPAREAEEPTEPAGRNGAAAEPVEAKPEETKAADTQVEAPEAALAEARTRIAELEGALERRDEELSAKLKESEAEFAQALRDRDEALKLREAELEDRLSQGYEMREAELNREFDRRQLELEKQLAVLEDRLNSREAELRDRATQREAKLIHRIEDLQSQLADAKLGLSDSHTPKRSRKGGSSKDGQLDLNLASFEELRELGLSVTQSARIIAYRDTRGGFDSLDELSEIPGLPKDTRGVLSSRLHL